MGTGRLKLIFAPTELVITLAGSYRNETFRKVSIVTVKLIYEDHN